MESTNLGKSSGLSTRGLGCERIEQGHGVAEFVGSKGNDILLDAVVSSARAQCSNDFTRVRGLRVRAGGEPIDVAVMFPE